jgi:hypothetical protein
VNVAIVTNLNGIGLQRDEELIADYLQSRGHKVTGLQYDLPQEAMDADPHFSEKYDLAIFLEVVPRHLLNLAPVKWAWLNPEWVKPEMIRLIDRNIDKVFAKTHEAFRLFSPLWPKRTHYTGFMARDQYLPEVERRPWFLHIGGNSSIRGTQAVVDAWRWKKNGKGMDRHLIVVSSVLQERPEIPMVTYYDRISEEQLRSLQNQCLFHIYPSATEGYGHALHEALGVDAFVISTDAPPMNEFGAVLRLPARKSGRYNLADLYEVSALDIYDAAQNIEQIYLEQVEQDSRKLFLQENQAFGEILDAHMLDIRPHQSPAVRAANTPTRIAFLGNFLTPDSTESMVQWALEERLDVEVETLQENKVNLRTLEEAMEWNDIFLWIHTRNFFQVPNNAMLIFLQDLRKRNVPTVSMHLDKFWGIPDREKGIGVDPFWKTQFVFTADGSRQDAFAERGVKHYWMKPAMSEVYCHPGVPREEFRCDVGFVGAKGYHGEYPFRPRLVDWLEETYGGRFKHITDVRGHALNDFYASCKVVVGDCIFAGTPSYWSDRLPETVGRYGNLLHPNISGLDIPVWVYNPQDLESLHRQIEMSLTMPEQIRKQFISAGAAHVQKYDTWTERMREILRTVEGVDDAKMHKG